MVAAPVVGGRRERRQLQRAPRHRAPLPEEHFSGSFYALGELAYSGARVSACVLELATGRPVVQIDDRFELPIGSLGRILPLIEVAALVTERPRTALELIDRTAEDGRTGPGLWRHLHAPSLPLLDVAALVGGSADAVATNALLRELGIPAVRERTEQLGLRRTAVLDRVRPERGPDDAPHFAVGAMGELAALLRALARGEVVDAETSGRVLGWLVLGSDHSLVASAFGLDPAAAGAEQGGLTLVNATGAEPGVLAEAGILRGGRTAVAYAMAVEFDEAGEAGGPDADAGGAGAPASQGADPAAHPGGEAERLPAARLAAHPTAGGLPATRRPSGSHAVHAEVMRMRLRVVHAFRALGLDLLEFVA